MATPSLNRELENRALLLKNHAPQVYSEFVSILETMLMREAYNCVQASADVVLVNQGMARMLLSLLTNLLDPKVAEQSPPQE